MAEIQEKFIDDSFIEKKKIPFYKKSMSINIGVVIVLIMLILAIFPEQIATHSPNEHNFADMLQGPSANHYFGTDDYGRDIFSRVVHSTRILGLLAGYYGKWVDTILMRILDIFMAFPFMVLVIAIIAVLGPGVNNVYIAIWVVGWKYYARLVRSEVLVIKNTEFIQAAKVLGYSDARILLRHILPNVLSSAIVFAAADVVMCMLAAASLSFLGLGVQPPTPEWGSIIAGGRAYITSAWWITFFPGLFLVIAGTGFSLIGDGMSDILRTKGK
jgi:peptide/nickel transport system permease protein